MGKRTGKKAYKPWAPEQSYLLPPSPQEWLPKEHLAYFVIDLVRELDLSAIDKVIQAKDARGTRPYEPRMMTALILYAYCVGTFSSRKIERATYEDVAFRMMAAGEHPYFTTFNEFRLTHREALAGLFGQVLQLCRKAGLATLGHVALDGSKVQANASKHKAMSYGRMKDEEKRLQVEIEGMLFRADEADRREDEQYGVGERGDELPTEFHDRDQRLKLIRQAKAELEKEAAQTRAAELKSQIDNALTPQARTRAKKKADKLAEQSADLFPSKDDDDDDNAPGAPCDSTLPHHRLPTTPEGKPADKAQRNFTDSDSRIMIRNGTFLQAYNAQIAVNEHQLIVAHAVTNQPQDPEHLVPMMTRVHDHCDAMPVVLTADSGYFSERNLVYCCEQEIDAHVAVARKELDLIKAGRAPCTSTLALRIEMHDKLSTPQGRETYAKRKSIVEPVFGQIKRCMGFQRFSLRGLKKAPAEWAIVCIAHNLLKLFRARPSLATA